MTERYNQNLFFLQEDVIKLLNNFNNCEEYQIYYLNVGKSDLSEIIHNKILIQKILEFDFNLIILEENKNAT